MQRHVDDAEKNPLGPHSRPFFGPVVVGSEAGLQGLLRKKAFHAVGVYSRPARVHQLQENAPRWDHTVGLCLGF